MRALDLVVHFKVLGHAHVAALLPAARREIKASELGTGAHPQHVPSRCQMHRRDTALAACITAVRQ